MKLKIPPLIQVIIIGASMFYISKLSSSFNFSIPFNIHIGVLVILIGTAIAILGVLEFRKARTTVDPRYPENTEHLVSGGIYQFSRNPMYLGFLLMLLGWFFVLENSLSFLLLPVFIIYMNCYQIKPEEEILRKKFGSTFSNYCKHVRRWI